MPQNPFDTLIEDRPLPAPVANPFDAIVSDMLQERQPRMRLNIQRAQETTPDTAAAAQRLSTSTGIPLDVVTRNLEEVRQKRAHEAVPYVQLQEQTPWLAEWLGEDTGQNAAVAQDDLEQLGLLEWIVTAPARAVAQGIEQIRVANLRSLELVRDLTQEEKDRLNASKFYMEQGGALGAGDSWFRGAITGGARLLPNIFRGGVEALKYGAVGAAEVGALGAAGGSVIPGVGTVAGGAAGAGLGFRAGATYGALRFGFELEAGLAFDEFQDLTDELGRPLDRDTIRAAAIGVGVINSGLEAYGLAVLAKPFSKLTGGLTRSAVRQALTVPTVRAALADAVKTYGKTLTAETVTEVAQRVVTVLAGAIATGEAIRQPAETLQKVGTEATQEAAGAVQAFALLAAPGAVVTGARGTQEARQASRSQSFFTALGEGMTASKTAQRAPQAVERLLQKAADNGPVPAVYAPVDTFTTYWQSKGVDPAAVATELTGDSEAYAQAEASGTDLRIPTARYARVLAGTEHNAFFANELRLGPLEMNAREEEAFIAEQQAQAQDGAEAATEPTPLDQIREQLAAELVKGGLFDERTAQQYAALVEQGVGTLARDFGADPYEVYSRYGVKVRRQVAGEVVTAPEAEAAPVAEPGELEPALPAPVVSGEVEAAPADVGQPTPADPTPMTSALGRAIQADVQQEPTQQTLFQPAYHGSPHIFERFSLQAIGTGEGAQAYGWGLYFSSVKEIAQRYREQLSAQIGDTKTPAGAADRAMGISGNDRAAAIESLRGQIRSMQEAIAGMQAAGRSVPDVFSRRIVEEYEPAIHLLEGGYTPGGRIYKVDIPDDADFLDWDKPASQQSPKVQVALKALGVEWEAQAYPTLDEATTILGKRLEDPASVVPRERLLEGYELARSGNEKSFRSWYVTNLSAMGIEVNDPTGRDIYRELTERFAREVTIRSAVGTYGGRQVDAEAASKALAAQGVAGIRYLDGFSRQQGEGTSNYVVFDDQLVQIIEYDQPVIPPEEGVTELAQGEGWRRGSIQIGPDRQMTINLFEQADPSTFLHEAGHFFLEVFADLAEQTMALETRTPGQERLLANYRATLKVLGVENRSQIGTKQQEQWAEMFEKYLHEGKAPSEELRSVMYRFRQWLLGVYGALVRMGAKLTPEVRQVFDRMLASDEQIAAAERRGRMAPLFLTAEQAGMTEERFALYRSNLERAHRTSVERLDAKLQQEVRREQEATWKERRADIRTEVEAEHHARPVYQALAAIRKGTRPDGTPLTEGMEPAPLRLSRTMIRDRFGEDRARRLPPFTYLKSGGADPDIVAELFGFTSADEMLVAIAEAKPLEASIEAETDRRMLQEHGSLLLDGGLSDSAQEAAANEDREIVLRDELRALVRLRNQVAPFEAQARREGRAEGVAAERPARLEAEAQARAARALRRSGPAMIRAAVPSAQAVREAAVARIGATKIKALTPAAYWAAATRAAENAVAAAARQNFDEAIRQKTQELLNLALYREAEKAKADADTRARQMRELAIPASQKRIGLAGQTYLAQINHILDRFEFARVPGKTLERRARMKEWIAALVGDGLPADTLPADVVEDSRRVNYKELTYDELVGVTDGAKQILHLARTKNRLLKSQDQREYGELRDGLVASTYEKNARHPLPIAPGPHEERAHKIGTWFASHARLADLTKILDGGMIGGPWWEAFMRPINEAQNAEQTRKRAAFKTLLEIRDRHYPRSRSLLREVFIEGVGSLTHEQRLAVALNWGNEGNRKRLLADPNRRWSRVQVESILNTLDDNDLDYVQEVWDYINAFWPEIAAKMERVSGVAGEKVEASPFTVHGREMRGGYYPIVKDWRYPGSGPQAPADDAITALAASYIRQTTKRGHEESRKEHVRLSVRLDLSVQFKHIEQVIHDLTHHEILLDTTRLLRDQKVQTALYETRGVAVYQQFNKALQDVALGASREQGDSFADFMRTGGQIAALGFNLWTGVQQPLGLFNGMAEVGPVWVARGMKRWVRDAASFESTLTWINSVSPLMRDRYLNATQDINDLRGKLAEADGWFADMVKQVSGDRITQDHILNSFLWHIGIMQRVADVPTWLGAFEKAMAGQAQGDEARASALADQAVINAQGSGRISDLSQRQRGGSVARLFLMFYSYGATVFGQTYSRVQTTNFKSLSDVTTLLGHLSLIYLAPATATIALANLFGRRDDDEAEDVLLGIAGEVLATALNTMMWVRELSGMRALVDGGESGVRGYAGPAGTRLFELVTRLMQQIRQGEADDALLRAINQVGGIVFRYPAAQAERTVEGWIALEEGRTKNPLALVAGPPRP